MNPKQLLRAYDNYPSSDGQSDQGKELPTIRQEPCVSLPTAPFLNPDISDAEARLAGARLHHAGCRVANPHLCKNERDGLR